MSWRQQIIKFNSFEGRDYFTGEPPSWVIDNLLPSRRLILMSGQEGSGKTKFALAMCRSIAKGNPFLGQSATQGRIAYFNLDLVDRFDIEQRCIELSTDGDTEWVDKIRFYEGTVNILESVDVDRQGHPILLVDKLSDDLKGFKLIIFDTLSRLSSSAGLDERQEMDMDKLLGHILILARRTGASTLILHHRPKDLEIKTGRGSTAIAARVDAELLLDGKMLEKINILMQKTRIHELSSILPIEITEDGFTTNQSEEGSAPRGAWRGLLDQIQKDLTQLESDCNWFTDAIKGWLGHRVSDSELMVTHNDLKRVKIFGASDDVSDNRRKAAIRHLIEKGLITKEKHGNNPIYYLTVDEEDMKSVWSRRKLDSRKF